MIIDNDLEFNKGQKRYYLTEKYVFNEMGTDLQTIVNDELDTNVSTLNKRMIKYACDMVYDFLEQNAVHKDSARYFPTQNEDAHNALKRALTYQLYDFIQVGDISFERGNTASDTVNNRAVQSLLNGNLFNTICKNIPSSVEEW